MPRVVVSKNPNDIQEANSSCPVQAFRKLSDGNFVIDPNVCIDCGVCQTIASEGSIVEDSEASQEDIEYNEKGAETGVEA